MKHFVLLATMGCLISSGCVRQRCRDCDQACHVTRSQVAPRPNVCRTTCRAGGGLGRLLNGRLLGRRDSCGDTCTDCGDGCSDGGCAGGDGCESNRCFGNVVEGVARGFCPHSGGYPETPTYNPGPPVGQVAYPYYTVRGPRDFLRDNPPSIGPY